MRGLRGEARLMENVSCDGVVVNAICKISHRVVVG